MKSDNILIFDKIPLLIKLIFEHYGQNEGSRRAGVAITSDGFALISVVFYEFVMNFMLG